MTMRIAMYKGPPDDFWHGVGHEGTCLRTRSIYSHCELVFGEPDATGKSLCASSSARDGGVRFKNIDLGRGRWDVYELPGYDAFDEAYAYEWFSKHLGAKYDHLGLVWFVLPISDFNDPKKFVCSEAIAAALRMQHPHKKHPERVLTDALKFGALATSGA
jgi:hypothetical protein